jgi:hypothetical protein
MENGFITLNVDFTTASDWLQRVVRPLSVVPTVNALDNCKNTHKTDKGLRYDDQPKSSWSAFAFIGLEASSKSDTREQCGSHRAQRDDEKHGATNNQERRPCVMESIGEQKDRHSNVHGE